MKFTCKGSIRGSCGIIHYSLKAANKCCDKDHNLINKMNYSGSLTQSYSDRNVVPLDKEAEKELFLVENK